MSVFGGKFKDRLSCVLYAWDEDAFLVNEHTGACAWFYYLIEEVIERIGDFKRALEVDYEGELAELTDDEAKTVMENSHAILEENSRGEVFVTWYKNKQAAERAYRVIRIGWGCR